MRKLLHDNCLSLAAFGLFVVFWIAMTAMGLRTYKFWFQSF